MRVLPAGDATIHCVAFAPDGSVLAGTKDGRVLALAPFQEPRTAFRMEPRCGDGGGGPVDRPEINGIVCLPGGRMVLAAGLGWRILRAEPTGHQRYSDSRSPATSAVVLDDTTIALGLGDRSRPSPGGFELWSDGPDGRHFQLKPIFKEPKGVLAVAVHRPERLCAWSTGHQKVTLWNPRGQDPVSISLKHTAPSIAFHPDGTKLAAAQEWNAVLLDVAKRHELAKLAGHTGRVTCVAYKPDGEVLATGSWDGTVRLWNGTNGAAIGALVGPVGRVLTLAYSPDGLQIAAAGDAGNVVLWDAD